MMNVTSDYYRTREGSPEVELCGLADRWMRSVRHAAQVAQADRQARSVDEPLRPSTRTLRRMERRFKH